MKRTLKLGCYIKRINDTGDIVEIPCHYHRIGLCPARILKAHHLHGGHCPLGWMQTAIPGKKRIELRNKIMLDLRNHDRENRAKGTEKTAV